MIGRLLRNDKAKLGLASALVQAANLLLLVLAKTVVSDADFAFVLTNLAIAGIIGSIASMRLEVLVFQDHEGLSRASIIMPVAAIVLIVAASFGLAKFATMAGIIPAMPSPLALAMMLGLALSAVLSFLFVQEGKINWLLAMRSCQAALLGAIILAFIAGFWQLDGGTVLALIGLGYAIPAILWLGFFVLRFPFDRTDAPALYWPGLAIVKRSGMLTLSTGVNSVYVNMPLLAAAATQSAGFVADFGLIMRAFTAPITLIFQVIGRLFLADAMRWSIADTRPAQTLNRLISKTMLQSVGLFLFAAPILFAALYLFRAELNFSHLDIAPFLFAAALGQCAINPVSQVRMPLKDEQSFLLFDIVRLLILACGLYIVATFIPFEMAFGATAVLLYTSYILFIRIRVGRYSIQ